MVRLVINIQRYQVSRKNSLNLGLEQYIVDTVTLEHSKWLMRVKRAYVVKSDQSIAKLPLTFLKAGRNSFPFL